MYAFDGSLGSLTISLFQQAPEARPKTSVTLPVVKASPKPKKSAEQIIHLVRNTADCRLRVDDERGLRFSMSVKSLGKILTLGSVGLELPVAAKLIYTLEGIEITKSCQLSSNETYILSMGEEHWAKAAAKRRRRHSKAWNNQAFQIQERPPAPVCLAPPPPRLEAAYDGSKVQAYRASSATSIQCAFRGYIARRREASRRRATKKASPFGEVSSNHPPSKALPKSGYCGPVVPSLPGSKLSSLHKYATTGLQGSREYLTPSPLLSKLKAQKAPAWWEDCVSTTG